MLIDVIRGCVRPQLLVCSSIIHMESHTQAYLIDIIQTSWTDGQPLMLRGPVPDVTNARNTIIDVAATRSTPGAQRKSVQCHVHYYIVHTHKCTQIDIVHNISKNISLLSANLRRAFAC